MFDSVQNNTWLFFPFITVWISVLYELSFQTLTKRLCIQSNSLKNFKDLHMFFKELACFILFSYQCSFKLKCFAFQQGCLSVVCISNSFILSCVLNFVNNFFQLFSIRFCSFEEGIENLSFYVVSCLLLSFATALLIYTLQRTKVNNFFKNIFKWAI